jgi:hypothetical protein
MLEVTQSSQVCAIEVIFGFNEACIRARGVPLLCQAPPVLSQKHRHTAKSYEFLERYEQFPPNTDASILYLDMRLGMRFDVFIPYLSQASFIVIAGPMCMIPFLYRTNDALIQTYKFHRRIYETRGISADRTVFDGDLACTCVIVYYRATMTACLPLCHILEDPTNALRHHYIRHALAGNIPEYWKLVLPQIPLKCFFKLLPPDQTTCPFDDMLIDVFANGHLAEEQTMDCFSKEELRLLNVMSTNEALGGSNHAAYDDFDRILLDSGIK